MQTNYCVLDLETGTKTSYGRKGNPWLNNIVAVGWKRNDMPIPNSCYYTDFGFPNLSIIKSTDILIGHNIKFDLLYLWKDSSIQTLLKQGLKIWDTQLVEYMLTGQQVKYASLRDIAVNKYNCPVREKLMEEYWAKKIDTKDIPKEVVLLDVMNDVKDTESIYLQQVVKADALHMTTLINLIMDSLLATTEMEYNGIYIDKQIIHENQHMLEQQTLAVAAESKDIITKYWKI